MAGTMVAVGDSITAKCTTVLAIGGLPPLAYPAWVAEHLGLTLTTHAELGASAGQIARDLLPGVADGHDLGIVYAGTNNVVSWRAWRNEDLAAELRTIVTRVAAASRRTLVLGFPENLGRTVAPLAYGPRRRHRVRAANAAAQAAAGYVGATFVPVPAMTYPDMWVDGIHPTSLGHRGLAGVVLEALGETLPPFEPEPLTAEHLAFRRERTRELLLRQPVRGVGGWLLAR